MAALLILIAVLILASAFRGMLVKRHRSERRASRLELLALATERGLSISEMLTVALEEQSKAERLRIEALREQVDLGTPLGAALHASDPDCFSRELSESIDLSGEGLPQQLRALATYSEEDTVVQHRFAMALLYPLILLTGILLLRIGTLGFLRQAAATSPEIAVYRRVTHTTSHGPSIWNSASPWFWVLTLMALGLCTVLWKKRSWVRSTLCSALEMLPAWRSSARLMASANYLRALSHLTRAGLPLASSMKRALGAVPNRILEKSILACAEEIEAGHPEPDCLSQTALPPFASASVAACLHSGPDALADTMSRAATSCRDRWLAQRERNVANVIPLSMLVLGVVLAFDLLFLVTISTRVGQTVMEQSPW